MRRSSSTSYLLSAGVAGLLVALAPKVRGELVQSSGTIVASFDTGDRNSGSEGDYAVSTTPAAGILHTDGLYMTGQSGVWTLMTASGNGQNTFGPIVGVDSQSGQDITFTYAAAGEKIQHNNQTANTPPRRSFWRVIGPFNEPPVSFTISGLDDSKAYDLIFYSGAEQQGPDQRYCKITINGESPEPDGDGDSNFTSVVPTGGVIAGTLDIPSSGIGRLAAVQVAEVLPPPPFRLEIAPNTGNAGNYDFSWGSRNDKVYDLVSSTDLSVPVENWAVWGGQNEIAGTAPTNTLPNIAGGGPERFFAVIERDPPPPAVLNTSFEEPVTIDGQFGALAAPWTTVDLPAAASVDIWNPTMDDYATAPDGENVCSIYVPNTAPGVAFGVSQVLGRTYVVGTDYTLTVQVGRVAAAPGSDYDWPGFRVELWAGAVLLGSDEDPITTAPAPGSFITSTVAYDHTTGPAATEGDPLEIRLLSRGQDVEGVGTSSAGFSVEFDQVEFSATRP